MSNTPNAADIQGRLEPVSAIVVQVLRKSVNSSRRFFRPGRKFDPYLFSTRMRYDAQRLFDLETLEMSVDEDEREPSRSFFSTRLANIGIELFYDGIVAKILKRVPDAPAGLAVPTTVSRSQFYKQQLGKRFHPKTGAARDIFANVIYVWDFTEKDGLSEVRLVCPSGGWKKKNTVTYHWAVDIPLGHPGKDSTIEFGQQASDAPRFDDLPGYSRPEDDTETGTNDAR
jgi:hypothetical protein